MIQTYIVRYYSRSSYVDKDDSLLSLVIVVFCVFFLAMTTHLVDFGQKGKVKTGYPSATPTPKVGVLLKACSNFVQYIPVLG